MRSLPLMLRSRSISPASGAGTVSCRRSAAVSDSSRAERRTIRRGSRSAPGLHSLWVAGVKYVPTGRRFQIRADVTDRIFKLDYPDAYYRLASDNTAVLPGSTAKSFYTHHTALTVGVSYLFAR